VSSYIEEHRERFGVEPICRTLEVSASAYYQRAKGERSARAIEDERLLARIREVHECNYCAYGYRRMSIALKREGEAVGKGRVQRLMREAEIQGAKRRGKAWRTTKPDPEAQRRPDLVERDFSAEAPNRLWVGDFTYLRSWEGASFFSFVIDAFSRKVVGWQLASHMRTDLVLDALRMALGQREPGADFELVAHTDRGSQGGFNWSSQHLSTEVSDGQAGRVDDRADGQGPDEVARQAVAAARCRAAVLARDRERAEQRGGRLCGWRFASGWQPVVSRAWRHGHVHDQAAVGSVPVL
jgi:putative transposase